MSTARKEDKQEQINTLKDLEISSFDSLVATISSSEYFSSYNVEHPSDGVATVRRHFYYFAFVFFLALLHDGTYPCKQSEVDMRTLWNHGNTGL